MFGKSSLGLTVLGGIILALNWLMDGFSELLMLTGLLCLLTGAVFSFAAIAKKEMGTLKFASLVIFFAVLFFITWVEPYEILRLLTWLKNIASP